MARPSRCIRFFEGFGLGDIPEAGRKTASLGGAHRALLPQRARVAPRA